MPLGLASLSTVLLSEGFDVKVFDTTMYKDDNEISNSQKARMCSLQVEFVDYTSVGVKPIDKDYMEDFNRVLAEYKPDLFGLLCVELTYLKGLRMLKSAKDFGIPTIVGGSFATFSPDEVISSNFVDMVCVGEGEIAIVELAKRMSEGKGISGIPNLLIKRSEIFDEEGDNIFTELSEKYGSVL